MSEMIAFILLRGMIAWFFLSPIKQFIKNWKMMLEMVKILVPCAVNLFGIGMIAMMFFGALSIFLGFYAQIGAAFLAMQSLLGVYVHRVYAKRALALHLSEHASMEDKNILNHAKGLGVMGNKTSSLKNMVIASALIFIALVGSGPYSLTHHLF